MYTAAWLLFYLSLSHFNSNSKSLPMSLPTVIKLASDPFPIAPHLSRSTSVVLDLQEVDGFIFEDVAFMVLDEGWCVSKVLGLIELGTWLNLVRGASDVIALFQKCKSFSVHV